MDLYIPRGYQKLTFFETAELSLQWLQLVVQGNRLYVPHYTWYFSTIKPRSAKMI